MDRSVNSVLSSANFADLIEIDRDAYSHWAMYLNNGMVIELTLVETKEPVVRTFPLAEIVGKSHCRIRNLDDHAKKLSDDQIKRNVKKALAKFTKVYDEITYNCEHFVTELRYGIPFSTQVKSVGFKMLATGGLLASASVAMSQVKSHK